MMPTCNVDLDLVCYTEAIVIQACPQTPGRIKLHSSGPYNQQWAGWCHLTQQIVCQTVPG